MNYKLGHDFQAVLQHYCVCVQRALVASSDFLVSFRGPTIRAHSFTKYIYVGVRLANPLARQ